MKKLHIILITLCLCFQGLNAQEVTEFRGNQRDGKFIEKDLLNYWPEQGPSLLWENNNIGNGYGSPAITGEAIYINGEIDSLAYLFAMDKKGNLLWKSSFGREWVYSFPGSRSTPTVVNDLVYVVSGLGNLYCFNTSDGSQKWSVNLRKDLNGRRTYHGHAESPLVYGNKVILVPGGRDTNVVAFDRFSGKIEWICKGVGEIPAYNSPVLVRLPERDLVVTFSSYHILGIDASSGELLWSHEQVNLPVSERKHGMGDTHSNSALYEDGHIYYIAGDGNCAVKLKLAPNGKSIEQVWRNQVVDNYMGGFIKLGDRIYSASDSKKNLMCIDANTGQVIDSLKAGCGAIIWADNLLYYYNQRGEMKLIRPGERMEQISSFKVTLGTKEHFSIPVIADGVMYIRHGKSLLAYSIKDDK